MKWVQMQFFGFYISKIRLWKHASTCVCKHNTNQTSLIILTLHSSILFLFLVSILNQNNFYLALTFIPSLLTCSWARQRAFTYFRVPCNYHISVSSTWEKITFPVTHMQYKKTTKLLSIWSYFMWLCMRRVVTVLQLSGFPAETQSSPSAC